MSNDLQEENEQRLSNESGNAVVEGKGDILSEDIGLLKLLKVSPWSIQRFLGFLPMLHLALGLGSRPGFGSGVHLGSD